MNEDKLHEALKQLALLKRACANLAAQHERFKAQGFHIHPVHPDSLRNISAAYKQITLV